MVSSLLSLLNCNSSGERLHRLGKKEVKPPRHRRVLVFELHLDRHVGLRKLFLQPLFRLVASNPAMSTLRMIVGLSGGLS